MRKIAVLGAMLGHLAAPAAAAPRPLLRMVADMPLPNEAGRWDYMSLDPAGALVLAHLGAGSVVVVDTRERSVRGQVRPVAQVHGVLAVPELGRIYATATGTNELVAIDARSLKVTARVPVGRYPDGLAYAAAKGKIYVSDKEGHTESVVDVRTHRRIGTIALGGAVGNSQYDPAGGRVFVNAEGTGELVEIDPATDRIVARTRLAGADGNHGLLIEPQRRLAFIACEGNDKLLVVDLRDRTVKARFDVPGEPDVLAYDPGLGILYVATESGPVHLFHVGADGVTVLGEVRVGPNAHTVAVDPVSHLVYFPLLKTKTGPVLRVMLPGP
jgi:YVTN family beta-propeller protein